MATDGIGFRCSGAAIAFLFISVANAAWADVVISTSPTQNMTCSAGICAPTTTDAVLSTSDLESLLASGNVKVTTTGSGVQASNIHAKAGFSWSDGSTLTLDAYQSIRFERHVSVQGVGGISLVTNDGGSSGTLSFGNKGRVSFANLSSPLSINGATYTLVDSIASLASAIAANSSGNFALADNYDASQDGTYSQTPISTYLAGTVQGLGNTISNISIATQRMQYAGGLLSVVEFGATVENLSIANLKMSVGRFFKAVGMQAGGLALTNQGFLFGDHVSGKIRVNAKISGGDSDVGGLVAYNDGGFPNGVIENSSSTAEISVDGGDPGGLVGINFGTITASYATGAVTDIDEGQPVVAGGLAGANSLTVSNSYATGAVIGEGSGNTLYLGGFFGADNNRGGDSTGTSYSTGPVTNSAGFLGGFVGEDEGGNISDCYWDTTTSGTDNGTGQGNVTGVTGLTTKQLKAGLPAGFDPSIWAEKKHFNNGFPYLIANPPAAR